MTPQNQNRIVGESRTGRQDGVEKKQLNPSFPTNYQKFLKQLPRNPPSSLVRGITEVDEKKKDNPGAGRIKIMLRVCDRRTLSQASTQEFLRVEENKKHVSIFVPSYPEERNHALAPKVYAFDAVFTEKTSQDEICSSSLPDVIQAVLQGADGAVFCYGQSNLGKTTTLFGEDNAAGIVSCAINWLYKCVNEVKRTQRFSTNVRVSAIEVYGRSEKLKDLLTSFSENRPHSSLCIDEDPLMGTQLQNQCEIPAPTADVAEFLLDAALANRSYTRVKCRPEARRHSHLIYTLHINQERSKATGEKRASGGRSRLHFIDLGSCEKTLVKTTQSLALSHSSLGHVIMSIVNNSKHVPFKESKLTSILREHLGNVNCRAVMLAHVSRDVLHYSDTLSTIQTASRIHRVIKKKSKSLNQDQLKTADHYQLQTKIFKNRPRDDESLGSSSGVDCTSGSELSCDTVIYVNKNEVSISDRELTDNEGPPKVVPVQKYFLPSHPSAKLAPLKNEAMVYNLAQARIHEFDSPPPSSGESCIPNAYLSHREAHSCSAVEKTESRKQKRIDFKGNPSCRVQKSSLLLKVKENIDNHDKTSSDFNLKPDSKVPYKTSSIPQMASNKHFYRQKQQKLDLNSNKNKEFFSSPPKASGNIVLTSRHASPEKRAPEPVKPPRHLQSHDPDKSDPSRKKLSRIPSRQASLPSLRKPSVVTNTLRREKVSHVLKDQEDGTKINKNRILSLGITNKETSQKRSKHTASDHLLTSVPQQKNDEEIKKKDCSSKLEPDQLYSLQERPEPVGCSYETEMLSQNVQNSFFRHLEQGARFVEKSELQNRSDVLDLKMRSKDLICQNNTSENAATDDVNFFCLTFATRSPLIPLSKRNFTREIANSIQQKLMVENNQKNNFENRSESKNIVLTGTDDLEQNKIAENQLCHNEENISLSKCNEIPLRKFSLNFEDKENESERTSDFNRHELTSESEGEQSETSGVQKMPKLDCSYAKKSTPEKSKMAGAVNLSDSNQSIHNPSSREVCLYNTNRLAISYVSTSQKSTSTRDLTFQPNHSPLSKRDKSARASEAFKRSCRHVIMKKSTSKEGATLTLVKKQKSTGPTLELLITNDSSDLQQISSEEKRRGCYSAGPPHQIDQSGTSKKVLQTLSQLSPKKAKWGGTARSNQKKIQKQNTSDAKLLKLQKPKTSLINKLLSSKTKSNAFGAEVERSRKSEPAHKEKKLSSSRSPKYQNSYPQNSKVFGPSVANTDDGACKMNNQHSKGTEDKLLPGTSATLRRFGFSKKAKLR